MTLVQVFEEARPAGMRGYPSHEFHWNIEPYRYGCDARGPYVRVGSWEANRWFHVSKGETDKQTLGNARRKLALLARHAGVKCSFRYEED
jgi:hypothetical protein